MEGSRKYLNCNDTGHIFKLLKRGFYISLIVILIIALSGCSSDANEQVSKDISPAELRVMQWIEDIDYLQKNLPKKHKNLFHTIKREDFDKEIRDLKNDVPKLKDYEIRYRLAQIVASVRDAHTALGLGFNDSTVYPIRLWWFNNDLRIINTDREHKDILGKKLVKINNVPVDEIVKKIDSLVSHENDQWLKVMNVKYIIMPDVLKLLSITSGDKVQLSLSDDNNIISNIELYPGMLNADNTIRVIEQMPNKPVRLQFDYNNLAESLYWYKYIPEDKILYFQYNQCIDRDVAKRYGYKDYEYYPDFDEFSQGLLKTIDDNDIDKFVVDLRSNTGGNSSLMTSLVSKLSKIDRLKNKGRIFVIVGRETFSSGVWAAVDFQKKTSAIFYGEPTGGNVNGYGDIKTLVLPNSKIGVSYSTKYFRLSDKYKEGFIPDEIIEVQFDNYKQGIDDIYEAIKNY